MCRAGEGGGSRVGCIGCAVVDGGGPGAFGWIGQLTRPCQVLGSARPGASSCGAGAVGSACPGASSCGAGASPGPYPEPLAVHAGQRRQAADQEAAAAGSCSRHGRRGPRVNGNRGGSRARVFMSLMPPDLHARHLPPPPTHPITVALQQPAPTTHQQSAHIPPASPMTPPPPPRALTTHPPAGQLTRSAACMATHTTR